MRRTVASSAGYITLLFGHNGLAYLIDAPHLYDRPEARITIPTYLLYRQRIASCCWG